MSLLSVTYEPSDTENIDVHDLYRLKGLMHRDISIFNMAYYRNPEGNVVGTLIDFDLATYPEESARPFMESSVPDPPLIMSPSSSGVCTVKDTTTDINKRQDSTVDEGEVLKNGQNRSGTASFMSIEALDLTTPDYNHHVCHELESIFYALIWHGVG